MNRRQVMLGGVAAAAALAGAGVAWRQFQPHGQAGDEAGSPSLASFWAQSFETPDGATMAMSSFQGRPLLLNFWATWCPPCVEELPLLDGFYRENKVKRWQQRKPLGFPVLMAGFGGTELSKSL